MDRAGGVARGTNQLLDALPAADSQRLMRLVTPVFLEIKTVLFEPGRTPVSVDFPRNCVVSLVSPFQDGGTVEVATVGKEGIVGVPLVLGGSLMVRAICSVAGWADRMHGSTFLNEVERDSPLRAVGTTTSRPSSARSPRRRRATGSTLRRSASADGC